jgi:hypothetical protein
MIDEMTKPGTEVVSPWLQLSYLALVPVELESRKAEGDLVLKG